MNYKKTTAFISLLSFLGILVGVSIFCAPDQNGICMGKYYNSAFSVWGGSLAIFIVSLALFFVQEEVYKSWKSFAIWWIPLSVLLILAAPPQGGGLISIDRELITWFTAGLYFLISLAIIAVKSYKLRGK